MGFVPHIPLSTKAGKIKTSSLAIAFALTGSILCESPNSHPLFHAHVSSERLQQLIKIEDLLAGSQKLQDFADANGDNRALDGVNHNATVDYLYDTLTALDYYDVYKQEFVEPFPGGSTNLSANGVDYEPSIMTYFYGKYQELKRCILALITS